MTEGREKMASNTITNQPEESVVRPFNSDMPKPKKSLVPLIIVVSITLGVISGILLSNAGSVRIASSGTAVTNKETSNNGKTVGSADTKTFKDCAQGQLIGNDGKITHEGTHILVRPGGESQNVFLTSSVVDLDVFLNKEVEICGQTNQAQKAGWLMDVGRVKTQ